MAEAISRVPPNLVSLNLQILGEIFQGILVVFDQENFQQRVGEFIGCAAG